ncbi:LysR family transcriptional regulator [Noviherbaspirillum aerium]|uniref:LysR family transcriptional regulator n=1 Tax=Noviherbaspirillum aerium TaxID=2588497 RepID=UPI00124E7995|nr:LysR family transcriptional regulator [Noviherbaspirillum aerium]
MDHFNRMSTFARVVADGSFSAAARKLQVSSAAVGKQIQLLENWLGTRLFDRTTRQLRLTEAGMAFHERCTRILEDLEEAQRAAGALQAQPTGRLRINSPVSFSTLHLGGLLADFLKAYPDISVDMELNDRMVNLVEEGFDLAVRIGNLPDSSLAARRIGKSRFVLCASPAYLKLRGTPRRPGDLAGHDCVEYALGMSEWQFTSRSGKRESISVSTRLRANNGAMLSAAVSGGFGVTYVPSFIVSRDLEAGRLVPLLPSYKTMETGIYIVYPAGRHVPAKVRVFIDFAARYFGDLPSWERPPAKRRQMKRDTA